MRTLAVSATALICAIGGYLAFCTHRARPTTDGQSAATANATLGVQSASSPTSGGRIRRHAGGFSGFGWSVEARTDVAIAQASAHAVDEHAASAHLTAAYYNPQHDPHVIVASLRQSGGRMGKIIGETTHEGILAPDGYHTSPSGVLGLLTMRGDNFAVGVGGASFDDTEPAAAAKLALRTAIADAGPAAAGASPSMVLLFVTLPNEEAVLAALEEETGPNVPLVGGTAAGSVDQISRKKISNWSIIANDKVFKEGVAVAVFYSRDPVAWSYGGGYRRTSVAGIVTRCEKRLIHEIDGRPAADVYDEWLGGRVSEVRASGGNIINMCSLYPLSRHSGASDQFIRAWPADDPKTPGALRTGSSVDEGDRVFLSEGTWNILLNHFASVPRRARDSIRGFNPAAGLFIYCGGALECIPNDERAQMSVLVNQSLGELPWIGVFTWGEQGYIPDVGNRHSNLSAGVVLFPAGATSQN